MPKTAQDFATHLSDAAAISFDVDYTEVVGNVVSEHDLVSLHFPDITSPVIEAIIKGKTDVVSSMSVPPFASSTLLRRLLESWRRTR